MSMPRHLMSPVDRGRAGTCIVSAVGPMTMPPAEVIRHRLVTLAAHGAHTRVGLRPSVESLWWRYTPEDLRDCVQTIEPVTMADLDELMSGLAQTYADEGIRVYLAGEFLLIVVSHGLCDARLLVLLQNILLSETGPGGLGAPPARVMLGSTIVRWFGRKPRRLAELAQLPRPRTPLPVRWPATDELPPARPTLRWTAIGADTRTQLLARIADTAPRATEATMWFSAIAKTLTHSGIEIADRVVVLADARRYRPEARTYFANFAVGLEFDFPDPYDPEILSARVQAALRTGRPLAAMGLGALKSVRPGRAAASRIMLPDKPVVSFSDIGRAVDERGLPWRSDERAYIATTEGVGYNGISFILVEVGKSVLVQCSFNAAVHEPARIEAMLAQLSRHSAEVTTGRIND